MNVLAEASLVNPTYKHLQEINIELTQEMKMSIMMFTQGGGETLKNFRKEQQLNENNQPGIEV